MERSYNRSLSISIDAEELHWRTAFHEAGHAAAIHILNRNKRLPPVFFEIQVHWSKKDESQFSAKVIDGNLIHDLPIAVIESMSALADIEQHSYQRAYEADIVNLLVGPLSEAKYIAKRDGEIFNQELINLDVLDNYGGHADLEKVQLYLEHFVTSRVLREQKLKELLNQAHRFIDEPIYWKCISRLAHFILESKQETVSCDQAIDIFDRCLRFKAPQHERWGCGVTYSGR